MKKIIFTGTWKTTNEEVERDVRQSVREVLARGDAIITGGALGMDYFCMDEVLTCEGGVDRLQVIIPGTLEEYIHHVHSAIAAHMIMPESSLLLEKVLREIYARNKDAIIELPCAYITQEEYFKRDQEEINRGDEVYAFHVNNSIGTQDTIDRAAVKGIPVTLHKTYTI